MIVLYRAIRNSWFATYSPTLMSNPLSHYEHVGTSHDDDILADSVTVEDWREHLPGSSGTTSTEGQPAICIDKGVK